ncbi:MAG TPA: hypothetical protein VE007_03670 [Thermoanaerobaculia bacterium]|nr:hypothetical protein [Thermoanaerobaculia bacterium]
MGAKQEGWAGFVGSCAPSWNGSTTAGEALRSNSIREDETAVCLDCRVTFNIRNRACPKCDSDHFWLVSKWRRDEAAADAPARPVFRLPPPRTRRPSVLRFRNAT